MTSSELAIAEVSIEDIAAVPGDIDIIPAVVIKIGNRDAHAPSLGGESGFLRDLAKLQFAFLAIESDHQVAPLTVAID